MPDYKEMYLKMARATEEAVRILIAAQQECEELFLDSSDDVLLFKPNNEKDLV